MIALGWTLRDAKAPRKAAVIDLSCCAVVASHAAGAAGPHERLRQQVDCARQLEAFLPLAPGQRVFVEQAVELACRRGPAVAARLEALRGRMQICLRADWPVPPVPAMAASGGRAWLVSRALRRAEEKTNNREVADALRRCLAPHASRVVLEREAAGRVQLAALCPATEVPARLDEISRELARGGWPEDMRFSITGPWPALAFAGAFVEPEPA